mmetsp:Transcript_30974/g.61075  ORF Transcript_30974/g.61075 Transcript_30974/m.61075 type:complete len:414 (-) Transcript_30974:172-1413(-)
MVDVWDGPPREGTRGGLEQFKWDSIKDQKYGDRECYLGHSVKIGLMGKFGQYYKNDWWQQGKNEDAEEKQRQVDDELAVVKAFEEELMQEALGVKPKRLMLRGSEALTVEQKRELLGLLPVKKEDKGQDVKLEEGEGAVASSSSSSGIKIELKAEEGTEGHFVQPSDAHRDAKKAAGGAAEKKKKKKSKKEKKSKKHKKKKKGKGKRGRSPSPASSSSSSNEEEEHARSHRRRDPSSRSPPYGERRALPEHWRGTDTKQEEMGGEYKVSHRSRSRSPHTHSSRRFQLPESDERTDRRGGGSFERRREREHGDRMRDGRQDYRGGDREDMGAWGSGRDSRDPPHVRSRDWRREDHRDKMGKERVLREEGRGRDRERSWERERGRDRERSRERERGRDRERSGDRERRKESGVDL